MDDSRAKAARRFTLVLIFAALAGGLGSGIFSNYYSAVYHIDSVQRGFLEIPRESPGILCMLLVALLGPLGNLWMSVIAQLLIFVGLVVMGVMTPNYAVMQVFLFLHSMGMHLFMPLNDALSMELAPKDKVGTGMGRFKGANTMASLGAACLVFVGFRAGWFDFQARPILPFLLAAGCTLVAVVLLLTMFPCMKGEQGRIRNHKLLFRRRYLPYYLVTLAYGCQKRIKIVFAPWVIIQLLGQGADTVALLTIVTYLAGTWAAPWIGRLLDRLGVKKMLWIEAGYIAVSFCLMGALAGMLQGGADLHSALTWLVFGAYVLCVLFEQFNMVHAFMMRAVAERKEEITQTLSVGLSIDHIMAVIAAPIMGLLWKGWGVQYVFYLAAASAVLQLGAAAMTGRAEKKIEQ